MRNKTIFGSIVVLAIAIVVANLNTASASRPSGEAQVNFQNEKPALLIEKLPGVARITTGIVLLNGISDGTIPVDQVISELLNLENLDLKTLENFNKASVGEFFSKLNNNIDLKEFNGNTEEALINIGTVRKSWKSWKSLKKSFPNNLDALKAAKNWKMAGFKNFNVAPTLKLLESKDFDAIKKNLMILLTAINEGPTPEELSEVLEIIQNSEPFFSFVGLMELANNAYDEVLKGFPSEKSDLISKVEKLKGLGSGPPEIGIMTKIAKSTLFPIQRNAILGFTNGFRDLEKMAQESADPWILSFLKPQISLTGLAKLVPFQSEMVSLSNKWQEISSGYRLLKRGADFQKNLVFLESMDFDKSIEALVNYITTNCPIKKEAYKTERLLELAIYFQKLQRNIIAIQTIRKALTQDIIDSIDDKNIDNVIQSIIQSANILENAESLGATIVDDYGSFITDFDAEPIIKKYKEHLECVSNANDDADKIGAVMSLFSEIREVRRKPEIGERFMKMASVIAESSKLIPLILKIGDNLKNATDFSSLKSLEKYYKSFGQAGAVSMTMQAASELKPILRELHAYDIEAILEELIANPHSGFVEEIQKSVRDCNDIRRKWGDFQETVSQISKFLDDLAMWEESTGSLKNTSLTPIGLLIADLAKLEDVDLSVENRLEALDQLIFATFDSNSRTKLVDIRGNFEKLRNLDLKFSSHKTALIGFPSTLEKISEIFLRGDEDDSMEGADILTATIITVSIIAFIICLVTAIWCFYNHKCPFWKPNDHSSE